MANRWTSTNDRSNTRSAHHVQVVLSIMAWQGSSVKNPIPHGYQLKRRVVVSLPKAPTTIRVHFLRPNMNVSFV